MRGNGLSAAAYVAVADVAPESADSLLLTLADHGVAAYASPSPEASGGQLVDRLYVDSAAEELARTLIGERLAADFDSDLDPDQAFDPTYDPPGTYDSAGGTVESGFDVDIDAAFAQIVAGYDRDTAGTQPVLPPGSSTSQPPGPQPPTQTGPDTSALGWGDLLRPPPAEPTDDASDRYVPPPPPPLPETDAITRFGWAGVLGGPAVLFGAVLFDWQLESWLLLLAAAAFLAGFVALVSRLDHDRDDDDPDDGAVV